jgi:hypothetical protein
VFPDKVINISKPKEKIFFGFGLGLGGNEDDDYY